MTQTMIEKPEQEKTTSSKVVSIAVKYGIFPQRESQEIVVLTGCLVEYPELEYTLKLEQDKATISILQDPEKGYERLVDECSLILSRALVKESAKDNLFYSYTPSAIDFHDFDNQQIEAWPLNRFEHFYDLQKIRQLVIRNDHPVFLDSASHLINGVIHPEIREKSWQHSVRIIFDYFRLAYDDLELNDLFIEISSSLMLSSSKVKLFVELDKFSEFYRKYSGNNKTLFNHLEIVVRSFGIHTENS